MSLPMYYEIGRAAAFSAADAHEHQPVDLLAIATMVAAYNVVIEMDHESDTPSYRGCPDWLAPSAAQNWSQYAEGYRDALYELKWTPPTPEAIEAAQRFASFERLGERLSARPDPNQE